MNLAHFMCKLITSLNAVSVHFFSRRYCHRYDDTFHWRLYVVKMNRGKLSLCSWRISVCSFDNEVFSISILRKTSIRSVHFKLEHAGVRVFSSAAICSYSFLLPLLFALLYIWLSYSSSGNCKLERQGKQYILFIALSDPICKGRVKRLMFYLMEFNFSSA